MDNSQIYIGYPTPQYKTHFSIFKRQNLIDKSPSSFHDISPNFFKATDSSQQRYLTAHFLIERFGVRTSHQIVHPEIN